MTPFESEMVEVLAELLSEFGFPASMKSNPSSTLDRNTLGIADNGTASAVLAMFFDPTTSSLSGYEKTLSKDYVLSKKWLIVKSDVGVETGCTISSSVHGKFKVEMSTAVGPSNPIYYRVATDKIGA